MPDHKRDKKTVDDVWRSYLLTGETDGAYPVNFQTVRRIFRMMPSDPRCLICYSPFGGAGGAVSRVLLNRRRSTLNPQMCDVCERYARENSGGAEIELSMLFADIRGSTKIAEKLAPAEFSRLINRFYQAATSVLVHSNAFIEKLIGDEVAGLFVPGLAGPEHARVAIEAARQILSATGHGAAGEPWAPLGVGVHTGTAYVGAVGHADGMTTISALGDAVNTTAHLASQAGPGEILVSEGAAMAAGIDYSRYEARRLQFKSRSKAVNARVIRLP